MERIIKFRAWLNMQREMLYEGLFGAEKFGGRDCEIMQFTGLLDKNGKEIYEGDVVQNEEMWTIPKIVKYEIVFDCGVFFGYGIQEVEVAGKGKRQVTLKPQEMKNCEIIGNIYENKDLLTNK